MHSKTYLVGLFALSFLNSTSVSAAALPPPYQERLAEQQQQQQQQQLKQQQLQQFQENLRQQEQELQQQLQQFQENLLQQFQELQQQQECLQPSSHVSSHMIHSTLPTPAQDTSEFVVGEIPDPSTTIDTPPPAEKLHCESAKSDNKKEQKKGIRTDTPVDVNIFLIIAIMVYPAARVVELMVFNMIVGISGMFLVATAILSALRLLLDKDIVIWKWAASMYGGAILVALALRGAGVLLKLLKMDAARNELSFLPIRFRLFSFKYGYPGSDSDVSVQAPVAGSSEGADLALTESTKGSKCKI